MSQHRSEPRKNETFKQNRMGPFACLGLLVGTGAGAVAAISALFMVQSPPWLTLPVVRVGVEALPDLVSLMLIVGAAMLALSWKLRTDLETHQLDPSAREELSEYLECLTMCMFGLALMAIMLAGLATTLTVVHHHDPIPAVKATGTAVALALLLSFGARLPFNLERRRRVAKNIKELERRHALLDLWNAHPRGRTAMALLTAPLLALVYFIGAASTAQLELGTAVSLAMYGCSLVIGLAGVGCFFDVLRVDGVVLAWGVGLQLSLLIATGLILNGLVWVFMAGEWPGLLRGALDILAGVLMLLTPWSRPRSRWNPRFAGRQWARGYALRQTRQLAGALEQDRACLVNSRAWTGARISVR